MSKIAYAKIKNSEEIIPIGAEANYVYYNGETVVDFINNFQPLTLDTALNSNSSNANAASAKAAYDFFTSVIAMVEDGQEVSY